MDQKPSVGRIVHYVPNELYADPVCFAAIIINVDKDDKVSLHVFEGDGIKIVNDVGYAEIQDYHTWHWPERV